VRRPHGDGGRDGSDVLTSQGVLRTAGNTSSWRGHGTVSLLEPSKFIFWWYWCLN
jgi:hypothetical protein